MNVENNLMRELYKVMAQMAGNDQESGGDRRRFNKLLEKWSEEGVTAGNDGKEKSKKIYQNVGSLWMRLMSTHQSIDFSLCLKLAKGVIKKQNDIEIVERGAKKNENEEDEESTGFLGKLKGFVQDIGEKIEGTIGFGKPTADVSTIHIPKINLKQCDLIVDVPVFGRITIPLEKNGEIPIPYCKSHLKKHNSTTAFSTTLSNTLFRASISKRHIHVLNGSECSFHHFVNVQSSIKMITFML
ncbi:hypothetical protein LXL04_008698 [Taraxacum kok-saghyz]